MYRRPFLFGHLLLKLLELSFALLLPAKFPLFSGFDVYFHAWPEVIGEFKVLNGFDLVLRGCFRALVRTEMGLEVVEEVET
jgi:hypothetical protein